MIEPDDNYDFVPPLRPRVISRPPNQKRGRQCGECGAKFEYNAAFQSCCSSSFCPMGFGSAVQVMPAYNSASS